jgi:uncharacterized protein (TIGR00255 family)
VISKKSGMLEDVLPEKELFAVFEPSVTKALSTLTEMRAMEGDKLRKLILDMLSDIKSNTQKIKSKRQSSLDQMKSRIKDKVSSVFETYPLNDSNAKALLETRMAQELAIIVDRTDFEEELQRLAGHLDHFEKVVTEGGPVGRKLDFILQELGREINTLGNKAQDISISELVVQTKTKLEQIREQVMNIE